MPITFSVLVQNAAGVSALIAALSFAVAGGTFIKTVAEYKRQNSLKRFEKFQQMRQKFKGDGRFLRICELLENDDPLLADLSFGDKLDFLGFLEEIALMHNSGLMKPQIVHYMFGYYAIRCYQSKAFWSTLNRDSYYWSVFCDFAEAMTRAEEARDTQRDIQDLRKFVF